MCAPDTSGAGGQVFEVCSLAPQGLLACTTMKRLILTALILTACPSKSLPTLAYGAEAVAIEDPRTYHQREGFTALVPPAHLPSADPEVDQVTVWLRLGPGEITTTTEDGRTLLVFPDGTRADRVETAGRGDDRFIADIRGTTLTPDGPRFHVFRPQAPTPSSPLFGAQWLAGSPKAHEAATQYVSERIAASVPWASRPQAERQAAAAGFRQKNDCLPCHDPARPENARPGEHGLVNRGTDGSGFFTPYTLFEDDVPMEQYGAFDHTLADPLIDVLCGEEILDSPQASGWDRTCTNGQTPRARWRWDRAWSTAPARAKQRCDQARWLFEHMDPAAQQHVGPFFDNCANPHHHGA